jgi:cellulose synthase/poly-beta-1,6-N-acetylglucosamine synthase-like glycosyltransferase
LTNTPHALPVVSVVVPCKGHARELEKCLSSLDRQASAPPFEVIVVDSAADPSVQAVVQRFAHVRLIRTDRNLLPGDARNLGVESARGEYLGFTDADCEPETTWVAMGLDALRQGARLVGGPILDRYPLHPIAAADNMLQFADWPATRPDGEAEYFPACNMALRKSDFMALGGFPETGLSGGEDTLLTALAATRWPGQLLFDRRVRVRHVGRKGLREMWRHQRNFGYARGLRRLRLTAFQERAGRWPWMTLPIASRRFCYILGRTWSWNRRGLPRLALLTPVLFLGLLAWARGFRRGLRESTAGDL